MIYTFHKPMGSSDTEQLFDDVRAIPESVSFWAVLFPAPWLIVHRLWFELAVYILLMILVIGLLATPYAPLALVLSSLPGLYLWLEGHNLRRNKLARQGFVLADVVDADNEEAAFMRFFDKVLLQRQSDVSRLTELGLPSQGTSS